METEMKMETEMEMKEARRWGTLLATCWVSPLSTLGVFPKELVGSRSPCLARSFLRSPRRTHAFFPDAGSPMHMKLGMGWVSSRPSIHHHLGEH
jgi:hypothetical protein